VTEWPVSGRGGLTSHILILSQLNCKMLNVDTPTYPMPTKLRRFPRIPKARRHDITRQEFDRVIDLLNRRGEVVEQIRRDLEIQFKRIAQLQEQVDRLKPSR
jgi:hypothetical protein